MGRLRRPHPALGLLPLPGSGAGADGDATCGVHGRVVALTFDDGPTSPGPAGCSTSWRRRTCAPPSSRSGAARNGSPRPPAGWSTRVTCSATTASTTRSRATAPPAPARAGGPGPGGAAPGCPGWCPSLYRPPWLCHWPWVLRTVQGAGLQVVSGTFGHPLEVFQPAAAHPDGRGRAPDASRVDPDHARRAGGPRRGPRARRWRRSARSSSGSATAATPSRPWTGCSASPPGWAEAAGGGRGGGGVGGGGGARGGGRPCLSRSRAVAGTSQRRFTWSPATGSAESLRCGP